MRKFILGILAAGALQLGAPALAAQPIVLNMKNTVVFRGTVHGASITEAQFALVEKVRERGKKNYPIYLVFDSPGGSISAGEAFIEFTKSIRNLHTISIFAASMASAIVEALPGRRYMTRNGTLMFHRAKVALEGQIETGEVESVLAMIKTIVLGLEKRNAARIGISIEDYKNRVVNEWWAYGQQAVDQKLADEVTDIVCTQDLIDSRIISTEALLFFEIKVLFSGCPLFRAPVPGIQEGE